MYSTKTSSSKIHLVSSNLKTTWSINFPILKTCNPTSACRSFCYAKHKRLAMPSSLNRQNLVFDIFQSTDPELIAQILAYGCNKRDLLFLRWCGSGDLFTKAVKALNATAKLTPKTKHWVTTRKPEMLKQIENLSNIYVGFSLDGSEDSKKRKEKVELIQHPRVYYSYVRSSITENVMGASIVFNMQQSKLLPYEDASKICPADAKKIPIVGACSKCKMCFSDRILKSK